jgi:hypothetical protein
LFVATLLRDVYDSREVVEQRPVLAVLLATVVSAAAYAGVSVAMRGAVQPTAVVLFGTAFAVVYVCFAVYAEPIAAAFGVGGD